MARFYGTIQGARGPASRLGHKNSGLEVTAQSYNGDVCVFLGVTENDEDNAAICIRDHSSRTTDIVLYNGPLTKLREGGKVELMRNWWKTASKKERQEFMVGIAKEALKGE